MKSMKIIQPILVALVLYIVIILCIIFKMFGNEPDSTLKLQDLTIGSSKFIDKKFQHAKTLINFGLSKDIFKEKINILIQFVNATNNIRLQRHFYNLLESIISKSDTEFIIFITGDANDWMLAKSIIISIYKKIKQHFRLHPIMQYLDINAVTKELSKIILVMQDLFSSPAGSYYSKSLFFIPLALHRINSLRNVTHLIMIDVDIELRTDIRHLYNIFLQMGPEQLFGLAREQQPTYRHITSAYRKRHKKTAVGNPPPFGLTGFNSGVKLVNLTSLRHSKLYNSYLDYPVKLKHLADKFSFRGHLGDQDFFTLLSFLHKDMFYELPCQWNRQLCEWWRSIYPLVFDQYFNCTPPFFAVHGNCDTKIESYY
ncbi:xyloside xylosyltransferase 1-like [Hydra vulgaris]|uniref:Xyloside xylosyltransferase 1 n=1 Tax=Hydra vulgaris TaxID=6087 RepID=A0ABM4C3R1_HYDVU